MKSVLILRHAKSSWKQRDLADHDRPLNKRGQRDAPRMGRLLRQEGLLPELILSSTAIRALTTATLVAEAGGYDRELHTLPGLYLAEPQAYVDVLRGLDEGYRRVMLVGHNPGIEDLVLLLSGREERMPTAALALVRLPVERWASTAGGQGPHGELVAVWRPKELD